jgi:hypothetical protein
MKEITRLPLLDIMVEGEARTAAHRLWGLRVGLTYNLDMVTVPY